MIKYTKFIKSINLKALLYRKREYYLKYTSKKQQVSNYSNFRILQIIKKNQNSDYQIFKCKKT